MSKPFKDNENAVWLVVRIILGVIFAVFILLTFFIKTEDTSFLYAAVHPWHWFFDTLAFIGTLGVFLFLSGYAEPIYEKFQPGENSYGVLPYVGLVCGGLMLLYYA